MRGSSLQEAVAALEGGHAAVFPTETVYGLGVSVAAVEGPDVLFELKGRSREKPVAWLVGSASDLEVYGCDVPAYARALADAFWPGPLTLIVRASDAVPPAFCSAAGTIGLRMPDSADALALVRTLGSPLATTSANLAGAPAPASAAELDSALTECVGAVVLGSEPARVGVASTVLDCTGARPLLVREGFVTSADIDAALAALASAPVAFDWENESAPDGPPASVAPAPAGVAGDTLRGVRMAGAVRTVPLGFAGRDGTTRIKALMWTSDALGDRIGAGTVAPRGIVHLVHGMAEHIERYDELARFFVEHGYVVCGADMAGHGRSVASPSDRGCLPSYGGADILVEDVHALRELVSSRFPRTTPYVLFGHSMGSFIVRAYLARYGAGLAAAVACGTGNPSRALSLFGRTVARMISRVKGPSYSSPFLDAQGVGAYSSAIEDARTPVDWLSTDPDVVDAYLADELCGFRFSAGGYATLTDLTLRTASPACAAAVPKDLPVLFIAGDQDPVGECGRGVEAAANLLRRAGVARVDVKLYPGMRHEIHNEPGRAEVFGDMLAWIEEVLS